LWSVAVDFHESVKSRSLYIELHRPLLSGQFSAVGHSSQVWHLTEEPSDFARTGISTANVLTNQLLAAHFRFCFTRSKTFYTHSCVSSQSPALKFYLFAVEHARHFCEPLCIRAVIFRPILFERW